MYTKKSDNALLRKAIAIAESSDQLTGAEKAQLGVLSIMLENDNFEDVLAYWTKEDYSIGYEWSNTYSDGDTARMAVLVDRNNSIRVLEEWRFADGDSRFYDYFLPFTTILAAQRVREERLRAQATQTKNV